MKGINFFLLGSFKVSLNGIDLTGALRTRKECAFLAYLAEESPRPQMRETLAELLWPDRPERFARMNLRQALLGIRKAFGGEEVTNRFLTVTESTVQIERDQIWLDTGEFNEHVRATLNHAHANLHTCPECTEHLEQAVRCYRGSFLDDIVLGDVSGFQEWLIQQRERHFRRMLSTLQTLSKTYFKQLNYDMAYQTAWRNIDLAPLEESAHRLLMRILYMTGRRNAALEQYQACKEIIQRELGVDPSTATTQLYRLIKQEMPLERMETGRLTFPPPPPPKPAASPAQNGVQLYDPLLHIPLQILFMDRLRHAITRMERNRLSIAVCVISVVYRTSQTLTHEMKKQIDQHLVSRLVRSVRKSDTLARLQEDEYALILEELKDTQVVPQITKKIIASVGAPIRVGGFWVDVQIVIGVSLYPQDGSDPAALLNLADNSMRTARLQSKFAPPSTPE